jgi:signal transduction histidine kinase
MTDQIEHLQRMELAGTLAGGIAHDLNNELTLVMGNLEIAIDRLPEGYEVHDWLYLAKTAAGRCAEMSRRLLLLSRTPHGAMRRIEVADLVEEARRMLECIKPVNTTLTINVEPDIVVFGNTTELQQILINLGCNAYHAMPNGGALCISAVRDLDHVWISVSDSGIGIPPSLHKRIFEPFFTTRADQGGSGLGLATAREIMKNHSGKISVDSAPKAGSTFTLEFPAHFEDPA